jgi:hypothetical protein
MAGMANFVTDFSSVAQDVIVVWYLNSNPTAEVNRTIKTAPHAAGDVVTVSDLNPAFYTFRFFETPDGTTLGTLLSPLTMQIKDAVDSFKKYEYVVGRGNSEVGVWADPADGDTQINDTRLAGADDLIVFSSVGLRQSWEYNVLPDGGIELAITDDKFVAPEKWTIVTVRKTDSNTGSSSSAGSGTAISGIKKVSSDGSFDATYYAKKNLADFTTSNVGSTSFPSFSTIPNGTKARFSTFTGSQRYWKLAFSSGDVIRVNGKDYNTFYLAKDEVLELEWLDGACYCEYEGRIQLAGNYVLSNNKDMLGTALLDGSDTEYNISDYQRLIDELPTELKVSYSDWDSAIVVAVGEITKAYYKNRGKFAVDNTTGKFKFPDLRGQWLRALSKTDGTADSARLSQGAGGMQAQNLIAHRHEMDLAPNANSGGTEVYGRGGAPLSTKGQTSIVGGAEQAVDNVGQYGLVYL